MDRNRVLPDVAYSQADRIAEAIRRELSADVEITALCRNGVHVGSAEVQTVKCCVCGINLPEDDAYVVHGSDGTVFHCDPCYEIHGCKNC